MSGYWCFLAVEEKIVLVNGLVVVLPGQGVAVQRQLSRSLPGLPFMQSVRKRRLWHGMV
ncbi:hypothetical protein SP21_76 [Salmonella phage 21]|nr:hypothetical protein SP21_76 [Salmonella phage 21]